MKRTSGFRLVNCVKFLAVGLIALKSVSAFGQFTATNALTIPGQLLGPGFNGDGNFNTVVFGNYNTRDGGTAGRLAVGGNFTLNSFVSGYTVGIAGSAPVTSDNFVLGGTLINRTGEDVSVRGNFTYGSTDNMSPLPVHANGEGTNINQANRIDFTSLKSHYTTLSNDYEDQPATVAPDPIVSDGNIVLTGTNTVANYVFNVTLTGNNLSGVTFENIPAGSGILINILNTNVVIASTSTSTQMSDTYRLNTIFNFPNATNISLNSFRLEGSVLAPAADLFIQTGEINGLAIIGGNITQATDTALPVKLISFNAKKEGDLANLVWETTSEKNAEKFVIQREKDNVWLPIGEVLAAGESSKRTEYKFTDKSPLNGNNLYRLKMIDQDGTFTYSKIISLKFDIRSAIKGFPNPVADQLHFTSHDAENIMDIQISTLTGKKMPAQLNSKKYIDVRDWQSGLYFVKITAKDGSVVTQKILKK